jgi:hypothetical protein
MKHFLIRYRFAGGTPDAWHAEVARFIAALESDPGLRGRIAYRAMRLGDGPEYLHLATAADDTAGKELGERAYFEHYTAACEGVAADGEVTVTPLAIVAETALRV